jgi:hypothetical protein
MYVWLFTIIASLQINPAHSRLHNSMPEIFLDRVSIGGGFDL